MNAGAVRAELRRRVGDALPRLVDMTQRLVRVASPNPPSDTHEVAEVAASILASIPGGEIIRVEPNPRVVSLIVRIDSGRPGRRLVFNGHLDTFPLGEDLPWTASPLGAEIRGGRMYGRGVSDMKGGLACSILAVTLLAETRHAWRGEIVLTLAGDEENMGALGTGHMLDAYPIAKGDAVICGDVGSPMVVRFGEKGLLWVEIEAVGRPAHGAHVHKGTNAIDRLREALDRVKDLERLTVDAPAMVTEAIRRAMPISEAHSGAGEAETLQRLTVNIGTISGGISPNLVPTSAIAKADIRLPVGIGLRTVEAKLAEWLGPLEGVAWRATRRFEPSFTDPDHAVVRATAAAVEEVLGQRAAINMRIGGSDARWYRMHGVPTVVLGLTPFNMGAADELQLQQFEHRRQADQLQRSRCCEC